MKYTLVTLLVAALGVTISSATTTINVANVDLGGGTGIALTDNTGAAISAPWAVGTYTGDGLTDAGSVLANFDTYGGTEGSGFFAFGGFVNGGTVKTTIDLEDNPSTTAPINTPIFVIFGNGATVATSTDFVVFSSSVNFIGEVNNAGITSVNLATQGAVVRGVPTTLLADGLPGTGPIAGLVGGPGVTFGAVPEPSVGLLAGLAALGLLRRRR